MYRGIVIINPDLPDEICHQLAYHGWQAVEVDRCPSVLEPISGHPDIQVCCLHEEVVVQPQVSTVVKNAISSNGYRLYIGEAVPQRKYPADVPYNAVVIQKYLLHHKSHTDQVLSILADKLGLIRIHVNQGYTCCSVLQVGHNALITADAGIANQAQKHGINVLHIRPGYVTLPGMDTGFFGGTGGWDGADSVFICGKLNDHPDAAKIREFITSHGKHPICLGSSDLIDYGSLLFLPNRS